MKEQIFWLSFSNAPGIGPGRFAQLVEQFGSAEKAWNAEEKDLEIVLKPALTKKFIDFRKTFSPEEYVKKMQWAKVSFVTLADKEYPQLLKQIHNPPFVLFLKGNKTILSLSKDVVPFIGVVGTRKITDYGTQVTETITRDLVNAGCVIVSGLALGVDAVAHQTTVDTGGRTIAVLGCGVDCCYPRENQQIYEEILDSGGLIVSEYGIGQQPTIGSFPSRNRIIAGLSQGVLVTEGAADSGALITAKDALIIGRRVFAVPGPVTSSLSQGPYQLIKQGASIVSSAKEILDELGIIHSASSGQVKHGLRIKKKKITSENKEEQKILDLLSEQDLHFDELLRKTKIDSSRLGTMLSLMEMKEMIKSLSAGFFTLNA